MPLLPLEAAVAALRAHVKAGRPAGSLDFARNLLHAFDSRGLSAKQAEWVHRLLARCEGNDKPMGETLGNVAPIIALFERARAAGLRYPKIRLRAANGARVVLAMAGERAREPGSLTITDGGPFGQGRYFGSISRAGIFRAGRDCSEPITTTLRELATDPAGRAAIHGHASGQCCFCARDLDDARSVAVGYGPVCAERFGLPWGEAKAPPVVIETELTQ